MRLLNWLIGRCNHNITTFPQGRVPDVHITCLTCGKEIPYDWGRMEVQYPARSSRNDYTVPTQDRKDLWTIAKP